MTCMFDQLVILWGEIRCLSLLGLKGLKRTVLPAVFKHRLQPVNIKCLGSTLISHYRLNGTVSGGYVQTCLTGS